MAGKQKLQRFAEMKHFDNVFEPTTEEALQGSREIKGKWRENFFKNNHPIVLELGCGKGEYSVGLARQFPEKNFIGVDIKGARIWRGAKTAIEENIPNVAFLRTRVEFITSFFGPNEVDEIWVTFPDPQPKDRQVKKRLTSPRFLDRYRQFLKPGGIVHLKTDNEPFWAYTKEVAEEQKLPVLESTSNLYGESIDQFDPSTQEILSIKTHYETIFSAKGFDICYLKFSLS